MLREKGGKRAEGRRCKSGSSLRGEKNSKGDSWVVLHSQETPLLAGWVGIWGVGGRDWTMGMVERLLQLCTSAETVQSLEEVGGLEGAGTGEIGHSWFPPLRRLKGGTVKRRA